MCELLTEPPLSQVGFPGGSVVKNLPASAKMRVLSLAWEDPLEKEMATPSSVLAWRIPWTEEPCLENPMDGGAWRAVVHGVAGESDTT